MSVQKNCASPSALVPCFKSTASSCTVLATHTLYPTLGPVPLISSHICQTQFFTNRKRRPWHIGTVLGPAQKHVWSLQPCTKKHGMTRLTTRIQVTAATLTLAMIACLYWDKWQQTKLLFIFLYHRHCGTKGLKNHKRPSRTFWFSLIDTKIKFNISWDCTFKYQAYSLILHRLVLLNNYRSHLLLLPCPPPPPFPDTAR